MPEIRVRHKDSTEDGLLVRPIYTWKRDDPRIQCGQTMSTSGGPKETITNEVIGRFAKDPAIDAIYLVRASGPPFAIVRKGRDYYDVTGAPIEVSEKRAAKAATAPAGDRPAERKPA